MTKNLTGLQKISSEILQTETFDLPTLWEKIDSKPSVVSVERQYGTKNATGLIVVKINQMLKGLPHQLDEYAIKKLAHFIQTQYKNLRFAELDIVGINLMRTELYGKINLNTIIREIDKYWNDRMDYAEETEIRKNHRHKHDDILTPDEVKKYYEQAKQKKPEPKKKHGYLVEKLKAKFGEEFEQSKKEHEEQGIMGYEEWIENEYKRIKEKKTAKEQQ